MSPPIRRSHDVDCWEELIGNHKLLKSGTLSRDLAIRTYGNYVRQLAYGVIPPERLESRPAGCGKNLLAPQGFDGLKV